ncbi:hypothetical protein HDV01_003387 [Terramyces sp. JEL0728]|nr:hypothetical protein HDV01_003387 [Terramyces sp. JEL0728]
MTLPITKPLRNAVAMCLLLVLADWVSVGIYVYNIVYEPVDTLYLINTCSTNIHASSMIAVFMHIKELLFHGRKKAIEKKEPPKTDDETKKLAHTCS